MSETNPVPPEKDELNENELEKVNGGAVDTFMYFKEYSSSGSGSSSKPPAPPPPEKGK